jgi:hypothetical protein
VSEPINPESEPAEAEPAEVESGSERAEPEPEPEPEPAGAEADSAAARRALDMLFYAPVGFVLTAVEDFPELAEKGRDRLEGQLRNAQVVGRFAVAAGQQRLRDWFGSDRPSPATRPPDPAPSAAAPVPLDVEPPAAGSVDAAIPGYDALSASQVVRRLDGLSPSDLETVYRHEATTRGRQTILHRAQQLLGGSGPD